MTLKEILAQRKRDKNKKVSDDTKIEDYVPNVIFHELEIPSQTFEGCTEF